MKSIVIVLAALATGGCATIVRGTDEPVQFISEPAGAAVNTSIGARVSGNTLHGPGAPQGSVHG